MKVPIVTASVMSRSPVAAELSPDPVMDNRMVESPGSIIISAPGNALASITAALSVQKPLDEISHTPSPGLPST